MREHRTTKMRKCRCVKYLHILSGCPAGARKWRISYFARVYLKTPNVTGSEEFLRCARRFFAGILTYFKKKWRGAA